MSRSEPRWKRLARKDDYVLVLRQRQPDPTWLKHYQGKLAAATRQAAAETRHLTGGERRRIMQQRIAAILKGAQ